MTDEPTVDAVGDPSLGLEILIPLARTGPTAIDSTTGALMVLRYHEIERVAHDRRVAGVGLTWFDLMGIQGELRQWYSELMFTNEGDAHNRLRRLVGRAFTPRQAEQLRSYARALIEAELSDLEGSGGGDLVPRVSQFGTRVICQLLGVPEEDVAVLGRWADALSPVFGFMDEAQIRAAQSALTAMLEYVAGLVGRRADDPGNDLITALIKAEQEGDRLNRREVVTMVANLLVAAHDTTRGQIACTLMTLLRNPEGLRVVRTGEAAPGAVLTETMRLEPSIGIIPRTVVEPLEIGGKERLPGTLVMLGLVVGNRDPEVWKDPDIFRADRFNSPDVPRPLSFGTGPHYCLGANLARMILEEVIEGTAHRSFVLAVDLEDVEWRLVLGRSPERLPVKMASVS